MKFENQSQMRYSFNKILLYDIVMARKSRKLSPFIKKVMAYYKAHKSEGISYGDAMKAVSKEMKKGGNNQEKHEQEENQQGGKRRKKKASKKSSKKSKKGSKKTSRRTRKK